MVNCTVARCYFEGNYADNYEQASNILLAPMRAGLGFQLWDAKKNSLTTKVGNVFVAFIAFTLALIPTLIGLIVLKISKSHPKNYKAMQAIQAQQKAHLPAQTTTPPQLPIETITQPKPPKQTTSTIKIPFISSIFEGIVEAISSFSTPTVTAADKQITESMLQAEAIYKNFTTATQKDKDALVAHLTTAYTNVHVIFAHLSHMHSLYAANKPLTNDSLLSDEMLRITQRLFYLYGRTLYGGDMVASQKMYQLSLSCILQRLNTPVKVPVEFAKVTNQLADLTKMNSNLFDDMDQYIMNQPMKQLTDRCASQSPEDAFATAETIFGIGATYQNITKYEKDLPRFERYFGLPKDIYARIKTPDSRWQIADIIYNTGRLIHYLKHPNDVDGALATLEEMKPYLAAEGKTLRAEVKRAQIHNITQIELRKVVPRDDKHKAEILTRRYQEMTKAAQIAEATPGFDAFLQTMFVNNRASMALDLVDAKLPAPAKKEIIEWFTKVQETIKAEGYNHYYHALFAMAAARCELTLGGMPEPLEHYLKLAENIIKKYSASCAGMQKNVDDLRQKANTQGYSR